MIDPITALAAGIAMGISGLGAGYAEAHIGAAAEGVVGEDEKKFSKALILMVIPETIAVFGFIIAVMMLML